MVFIVGVLVSVAAALFIYALLDLFVGKETHESMTIQRRLHRLMVPGKLAIARSSDEPGGAIWSVDRIFRRQQLVRNLRDLLVFSGWHVPLIVVVAADFIWAAIVFFFVYIAFHSAPVAWGVALCMAAIPYWILVANKKRYIEQVSLLLPDALLMMKNALRAGQSIQSAFQIVAQEAPKPVSAEFGRVVNEVDLGANFGESLAALSERIPTKDMRMFVLGIFIQQEIGGNLAELFDNIEKSIRDRISLARELKSLTAQGKLSGVILILLPIVVGVAFWLMNPSYFDPLIENVSGRRLIYFAIFLQVVGSLIIRKLTSISIAS